ncbi:hypothetical protein AHAS_Ahas06G0166200 [Arachis hypogaea]
MGDNPDRIYHFYGVAHIADIINEEEHATAAGYASRREVRSVLADGSLYHLVNCIQKFAVNCSWFQETFGELPNGADESTVKRNARAYTMMLLGTQLFGDKSGSRIHIRWLSYVARLEDMGGYSWGSATLSWLSRCMCRMANGHMIQTLCRFHGSYRRPINDTNFSVTIAVDINGERRGGHMLILMCSNRQSGTDEDAPTGLKLEQVAVTGVWVFQFEPPELETT